MDDLVKPSAETLQPSSCLKTASMLQEIATATSGCISEQYFTALVSSLSTNLGMEMVCIGEITNDPTPAIQTKAAIFNEQFIDNFRYELAGTPCEKTLNKKTPVIQRMCNTYSLMITGSKTWLLKVISAPH